MCTCHGRTLAFQQSCRFWSALKLPRILLTPWSSIVKTERSSDQEKNTLEVEKKPGRCSKPEPLMDPGPAAQTPEAKRRKIKRHAGQMPDTAWPRILYQTFLFSLSALLTDAPKLCQTRYTAAVHVSQTIFNDLAVQTKATSYSLSMPSCQSF